MKEITGLIDHRILLNYRIDADVMAKHLPKEFKPKLYKGFAIGGICQVSLSGMRPSCMPMFSGTSSHNIAHRIAVVSSKGEGVYIPRRDTDSWLNTFSGGLLFPGLHFLAEFQIVKNDNSFEVEVVDQNKVRIMSIKADISDRTVSTSLFESLDEVSDFFKLGNIGWSPNKNRNGYDAIELKTFDWNMEPLKVERQYSSYFNDLNNFPKGSVEFDSALIMRDIKHSWISKDNLNDICC